MLFFRRKCISGAGVISFSQILLTLRAIGNIGRSEVVSLRLQPCFTKSDLPMDVRVAALDAYRRMPCSADVSRYLGRSYLTSCVFWFAFLGLHFFIVAAMYSNRLSQTSEWSGFPTTCSLSLVMMNM